MRRSGCVLLAVCVSLSLLHSAPQRIAPDAALAKLTTVLQDLARTVPQDQGNAAPSRFPAPIQSTPLDVEALPKAIQDAVRSHRMRVSDTGGVQVYVLMSPVTLDRVRQLAAAGLVVELLDVEHGRVQAHLPATRLQQTASFEFVDFIKLPTYATKQAKSRWRSRATRRRVVNLPGAFVQRAGSAVTEGDAIMRADAARAQFGLDGTSVRVGVLSDGLKGVFASGCTTCGGVTGGPIATADLPDASGTRTSQGVLTEANGGITGRSFRTNKDLEGLPSGACGFAGAGAEGTALLEIVHDLAPGAGLSFANADTDLAFNQAVNYLASTSDVVVDDLGFFGLPADGTSTVSTNTATALNNAVNPIRAYVTSNGNQATAHYLSTYADSGISGLTIGGITNSGRLHLFRPTAETTDVLGLGSQPYDVISLPRGGEVVVILTWDDRFGGSGNNYDLYLIEQSTGRVVARGTDSQTGSQDPVEAIDFTNNTTSGFFRIVIQNVRDTAQPKLLNLYSFEPECATDGPRLLAPNRHERHNYNTPARSVVAQSDAGGSPVGVISVGAICSASATAQALFAGSIAPDESCSDRSNGTIEFFSSRGPTLDGRMKPDLSAIDGVSITGAGGFERTFFGTSAAAPHVAGEAALLLAAAPCFIANTAGAIDPVSARQTLRNLIVRNTAPVDAPLPDNTFGAGRADVLLAAAKTVPPAPTATTLALAGNAPSGANLTAAALGFTDPVGCGLTRLSWTGGCGSSPGAALGCPFGTSQVAVRASSNGISFSDPANFTITVSDFGIATSPSTASIRAGQTATYQVTVTPQGGAISNPLTLSCSNLPPGVSCAFNPATVSPGANGAQSTLMITTSSIAAAQPANFWGPRPISVSRVRLLLLLAAAALAGAVVTSRRRPRIQFECWSSTFDVRRSKGVLVSSLLAVCSCGGAAPPAQPPGASTPAATLSPAALSFGVVGLRTSSAPQSVTLANSGTAILSITSVTASGDFSQTSNCGASLTAGANCTIQVVFTPTAAGVRTGTLTVTDNAGNSPQSVGLTGSGQAIDTPAGTYGISVSAASGALVHSNTVTLIVQ